MVPDGVTDGPHSATSGRDVRSGTFRLEAARYKVVFAERRSFYGRTVVMWLKRGDDAGCRAGVVVSKRTFRRAVDRNRAKRLLRAAFQACRGAVAPDTDMILIARRGIEGKKSQDVAADIKAVCRRAGVWCQTEAETDGGRG